MEYKHIRELIREGKLVISAEAAEELNEEEEMEDEEYSKKEKESSSNDIDFDSIISNTAKDTMPDKDKEEESDFDDTIDDSFLDDAFGSQFGTEPSTDEYTQDYYDNQDLMDEFNDLTPPEEIEVEEEKPIRKIQTVDVVAKVIGKYDEYANKVDLVSWNEIVCLDKRNKKKKSLTYWDYIEDMHTFLNKSLISEGFVYLDIYNALYEKLTGTEWAKGLRVYSTTNYGRPYVTEGLFLLMYELSFDWAGFMIKFYNENPEINADEFEEDSFVKKFPNLTLLTYIAKLVTESEEFNKFMTDTEAYEMMNDDQEYNLTMTQVKKKKSLIKGSGESLTYFANLVKHNYADILAGALDKLGTVIYLHNNCKMGFSERLNVIKELITSVSSRKPIQTNTNNSVVNEPRQVDNIYENMTGSLKALETISNNLLMAREEARLMLEADKKNYIMRVVNE